MEDEPVVPARTTKEVLARYALCAALAFSSLSLASYPFEPSCGQKIYQLRVEQPAAPAEIGFTFSEGQAQWLGLDPLSSLEQLAAMGFTIVRFATYMNQPTEEMLAELSAQIAIAREHDLAVILAVGGKAPHYPEWYIPPEAEEEEIQKAHAVIERFGNDPAVTYWQLSNEPFEASNGPEKERVLQAIHAKMREYDKPIIVSHLIDLLWADDGEFRKVAAYADIIGLNDFLQVNVLRDTCRDHVRRYQHFRRLADEFGVELWITESQTRFWPAKIPFTPWTIPRRFYEPFQPEEILTLHTMQTAYLRPRVILHWEVLSALEQAAHGDDRALRAIAQTIRLQQGV